MTSNFSNQNNTGTVNPRVQSFLEALRASQNGFDPSKAEKKPSAFSEFQAKKEIEKKRIEQFHQVRSKEWTQLYSAKKKEETEKLERLRIELKQLASQIKDLKSNLSKAIEAPIVETGEYQENYLEHLKNIVRTLLVDTSNANQWLALYQSRSKKKGHYWGMASKKGNSYTQNSERAVATAIG